MVELVTKESSVGALDDVELLKELMIEAAGKVGAEVRDTCFVKFEPQGVSGMVVISESHFSVHTWPEMRAAALDFFTCGEINPWIAIGYLVEKLDVNYIKIYEVPRYVEFL